MGKYFQLQASSLRLQAATTQPITAVSFACAHIETMSISAVASLRPVRGQCLRHATTGLLSVQVKSPAATVHLRAVVALRPQQKRHQSTSQTPQDKDSAQGKPQITFRQFAGRALGVSLRNLVVALSPRGIRQSYRENPGVTTLNVLLYVSYYQDAKLLCSNVFLVCYSLSSSLRLRFERTSTLSITRSSAGIPNQSQTLYAALSTTPTSNQIPSLH